MSAPNPEPQPAPDPAADLIAQYELGDSIPEPQSSAPSPPDAAVAPAGDSRPRDPATGRFLPQTHEHSLHLTRLAADLGFTKEEIQSASPEALQEQIYLAHRASREAHQDFARSDLLSSPSDRPPPQRQVASQPPPEPTPEEAFEIKADEWDPNLVKALQMVQSQAKVIQQLEQRLNGVEQHSQVRAMESAAERFDRFFAKHTDIFGEGTGQDMMDDPTQASQYRRRLAIIREVADMDQRKQRGTWEQKAERACKLLFDHQPANGPGPGGPSAARESYPNPDDWKRAGLARPTQRAGARDLPPGDARAIKNLAAAMKDNGMLTDQDPGADDFLE